VNIRQTGPDSFEVESVSGGIYTVQYGNTRSCTCPAYQFHGERTGACKHLLAVSEWINNSEGRHHEHD